MATVDATDRTKREKVIKLILLKTLPGSKRSS